MARATTTDVIRPVEPDAAAAPAAPASGRIEPGGLLTAERSELHATPGFYRRSWRRFRRNRVAMTALVIFAVIALFVLAAPLISRWTGFGPYDNHLATKLAAPLTRGYLLGSDGNGRDILTRLAYGGRVSLMIAFLATISTLVLGGAIGLISGFFGGWTDTALMRLVDILLSIPGLPLLILIATLYNPGPAGLAMVLAAVGWPGIARIIRGEVLSLRGREYIEAARVSGAAPARIVVRHLLPNVAPLIVVFASLAIPGLILAEASLSFLGIGVQVPTPSWGNMLGEAQRYFRTNTSNVIIPGAIIYLTSLTLYLIGSGLRDAFDPRLGE